MPTSKRHHFVPQMILNGFTDQEGWLHWCRPADRPIVVRPSRPLELFYQKHLYSTVSEQGIKDPAVELELSRFETDAARVVHKIVQAAMREEIPRLSKDDEQVWHAFLHLQWRRTPEAQMAACSDTELLQMLEETCDEMRQLLPGRAAEVEALSSPEAKARMVRNVRVEALRRVSGAVAGILARRGVSVLLIRKRHKKFIIGSRPVVKITPKGKTDLNDPEVELWMPIASQVAAGAGVGDGGISLWFLDDDRPIRQLNETIAAQSSIIAAASADLVRSVARPR
ncbi:DUF4238 domain-containing protein [Sphingomonas arenae]|uniref:DUF4238 domain-containing protein n=1 Tax=Sphingomonas arenae TaxID=2812555 RepID=UPI00234FF056|nr:DUF4238 domain-containing protein [Sphingomonas arenae]